MVKLKIKHFGPIVDGFTENDGFMNISRVTLICGNQATGKSAIAKLFSTLTWLEKAVFRNDYDEKSISSKDFFVNFLKNQRIHEYLQSESEIIYIGKVHTFSYKDDRFTVTTNHETVSTYIRPKIMYIPSERNLLSTIEDVGKTSNLPVMLSILLDRYHDAQKKLAIENYSLPISGIKVKFDVSRNTTTVISSNNKEIDISNSSSGIQSVTPLFLVSDYLSRIVTEDVFDNVQRLSASDRDKIKKNIQEYENKDLADKLLKALNMYFLAGSKQGISKENVPWMKAILQYYFNHCFINIVEEPEQNLYPKSLNLLLYKLLEFMNRNANNQLFITTHSPYIISYLTLCAKACELKEKGADLNKLNEIVPISSLVPGKSISIYETTEDGKIELLKPYENLPSDNNLLNKLLAEPNEIFAKLLELEEE